jgi:aryl carrier-like protein
MSDRAAVRQAVIEFLRRTNPGRDVGDLAEDSNLMELGLLDSLRFMDLVLTLEQVSGRQVDFLEIDPLRLLTLHGLYDAFASDHA